MIIFVLLLFAFVTLLTLAKEFKWSFFFGKGELAAHLEIFIPRWSFFAPIPCTHDYHLLFRYFQENGTLSSWKSAHCLTQRPFYSFLWNPKKRQTKAVFDAILELLKFAQKEKDKRQICVSLPYLQLLNYVNSLSLEYKAQKIQFTILSHSQTSDYEVAFISEPHVVG